MQICVKAGFVMKKRKKNWTVLLSFLSPSKAVKEIETRIMIVAKGFANDILCFSDFKTPLPCCPQAFADLCFVAFWNARHCAWRSDVIGTLLTKVTLSSTFHVWSETAKIKIYRFYHMTNCHVSVSAFKIPFLSNNVMFVFDYNVIFLNLNQTFRPLL